MAGQQDHDTSRSVASPPMSPTASPASSTGPDTLGEVLRPHAEHQFAARAGRARRRRRPRAAAQLAALAVGGGHLPAGRHARRRHGRSRPKYVGQRRLIEIAVATLATDRALLLLGVPGTAKTWVSEHLAAAISGDSTLLVQGTAGTAEETAALRLELRPAARRRAVPAALVPSPVYRAMERGRDRPRRGAHPHARRRAGRADHGARRRRRCRSPSSAREVQAVRGLQRHRHRQRPRPRRQRPVGGAAPPLQHRGAARCPPTPTRRSTSSRVASPSSAARSSCPRCRPPPRRSAGSSPSSASCAAGLTEDGRTSLKVPDRHAVDGRGDLGGHQRPRARRALRRRRAAARPTSRRASSARS